jgi:anion-transporting  ArsA/GET3 family ATPase
MQDAYMEKIDQEFGNRVRAVLPLLETEVRGVDMLKRMVSLTYN